MSYLHCFFIAINYYIVNIIFAIGGLKNEKIMALLLAVLMFTCTFSFCVSAAAPKEMTSAQLTALAEGGTVTLTEDVIISGKLTFSQDIKIDLSGFTLTVTEGANMVTNLNTVIISNGILCIDNVKATASDGILLIGQRSKSGGKLVLDNVTVNGKDIMSAAGTLFIYNDGVLEMTDCTVNIENEEYSDSALFYSNGIHLGVINITESEINLVNGCKGFYTGQVTVKDSEVNLNVFDHGFNGNNTTYIIDNSKVTIDPTEDGEGRGVGVYGTTVMELKNGSMLNITNNTDDEGCIVYKSGCTGGIKMDSSGNIVLQGERPLYVEATGSVVTDELLDYFDVPEGTVLIEKDGALVICAHENTELQNSAEPTCTEEGYTGDIYCKECGWFVSEGQAISADGHTTKKVEAKVENSPTAEDLTHVFCLAAFILSAALTILISKAKIKRSEQ